MRQMVCVTVFGSYSLRSTHPCVGRQELFRDVQIVPKEGCTGVHRRGIVETSETLCMALGVLFFSLPGCTGAQASGLPLKGFENLQIPGTPPAGLPACILCTLLLEGFGHP